MRDDLQFYYTHAEDGGFIVYSAHLLSLLRFESLFVLHIFPSLTFALCIFVHTFTNQEQEQNHFHPFEHAMCFFFSH